MTNPYPFYFCPNTNDGAVNSGTLVGIVQQSSAPSLSHHPENFLRLQQYVENLQREQQRNFEMFVQLEQEKRTILAWNSHLERENAALKAEIVQLKNANATRGNGQQTESQSEGAKQRPGPEMNSEELIDALIGDGQHDHRLANGTANCPPLAIGISGKKRPLSEANGARATADEAGQIADEDRDFGKQIEQIICTILNNHSPRKVRRQSVADAQVSSELAQNDHNYAEETAEEEDDIECLGIVPLCDSSSSTVDGEIGVHLTFDQFIEFPPSPKTPPLPVTPPLPSSANRSSVGAEFETETEHQTIDEISVSFPQIQLPPPGNSTTPTANANEEDNAWQRDGAAVEEEGRGGAEEEEVIFMDDICRNKWVPSMAKREPITEWEEVVIDEEEEQRERTAEVAAQTDNAARIPSTDTANEQQQKVKWEIA
ncbi:hypothetical protein niasHT_039845 [Heterodera trifolii]|uniref:Uncharacterized protein n=1 Tax=Heterodera trifolii TaxID=157864 RepID=A0ABD2IYS7_9BILA